MAKASQIKADMINALKTFLPENNDFRDIGVFVTLEDRKGTATLITRIDDHFMVNIYFEDDVEVGNLKYLTIEEIAAIADQIL